MPAQTIRIKIQQNQFVDGLIDIAAPLVDGQGATPPTFTRGTELNFELGFFNAAGTAVISLTGIESVTVAILEPGAGGRSYYQGTKAVGTLTTFTPTQWNAGTHEHATWALTSADANIPTNSEARPLVLTCWALTTPDGSGNRQRHFLGGGYLQLLDPGIGGEIAAPNPLPYPAVTIGELAQVVADMIAAASGVGAITGSPPTTAADARGTAGSSVMLANDGFFYFKTASGWARMAASLLP